MQVLWASWIIRVVVSRTSYVIVNVVRQIFTFKCSEFVSLLLKSQTDKVMNVPGSTLCWTSMYFSTIFNSRFDSWGSWNFVLVSAELIRLGTIFWLCLCDSCFLFSEFFEFFSRINQISHSDCTMIILFSFSLWIDLNSN